MLGECLKMIDVYHFFCDASGCCLKEILVEVPKSDL